MPIHSTERLATPTLAPFQGQALLVYNDAVFKKSDFENIQKIGKANPIGLFLLILNLKFG